MDRPAQQPTPVEPNPSGMTGAEAMVRTLVAGGIKVVFANPGTSELPMVAALDRAPGMRGVLTLFEGVATGAADGYARMAGRPAATLLHLGPGLANGLANLHNASKASTPLVNIIGDHASYHRAFDSPLTSDIEAAARPFSCWVKTSASALRLAEDAAAAVVAARTPPGGVATLIVPADAAWGDAEGPAAVPVVPEPQPVDQEAVLAAAGALRSGEPALLLLSGEALGERGLVLADAIAVKTGARVLAQTFNRRIEHGAGRPAIECLPYPVDMAVATLARMKQIVLVGAPEPIAFFAYRDKPSRLTPPGARIHTLAGREDDAVGALERLADELGARPGAARLADLAPPEPATGALTPMAIGQSFAALIPDNAIIVDESVTTGFFFLSGSHQARPHSWLQNMGGSIGFGMPAATGAAIACPERRVIGLQADGSAMYTLQALWTQAREGLNVTTVIFNNRAYAILRHELANLNVTDLGRTTRDLIDLSRPDLDFVALAKGMGVPGARVGTMDEFNRAFAAAAAAEGPYLIEAMTA